MPAKKLIQFPSDTQPKPSRKRKGQRADGLIARYIRYTDLQGVSRRKVVYGSTAQEADQKKREFLQAVNMAVRVEEQGKTVQEWTEHWLDVYKRPHVSAKRLQAIGYDLKRITTALGTRRLSTITQSDLQALLNTRKGKSNDAIRKTMGIIKAVFRSAAENRLIVYSPAEGLEAPKGTTGTHRALQDWEVQTIIKAVPGHRFGLAAMLMLFAGLRKGEVAALHLDRDVDLKAGTITISRAISYVINQGEEGPPKSAAGLRTIPIMPPLLPYLQAAKGYAIEREGDGIISLQALNNAYRSFLITCELVLNNHKSRQRPKDRTNWKTFSFRCHDLRHTYATMLYDAGVDVKTAQRWLGHASPEITMKLYTHLSQSREDKSTEAAVQFFSDKFDAVAVKMAVNPDNESVTR